MLLVIFFGAGTRFLYLHFSMTTDLILLYQEYLKNNLESTISYVILHITCAKWNSIGKGPQTLHMHMLKI